MDWASLGQRCPKVFERIIYLAANGSYKRDHIYEPWLKNEWIATVQIYGQVCTSWKQAILNSTISKSPKFLFVRNGLIRKQSSIYYEDKNILCYNLARRVIRGGYLQVVNFLNFEYFLPDIDRRSH